MDANKVSRTLRGMELRVGNVSGILDDSVKVLVAKDVYTVIDDLEQKDDWATYESGKAHGYKEAIKDMKELLGK